MSEQRRMRFRLWVWTMPMMVLSVTVGLAGCVFGDLSEYETDGDATVIGCADGEREGFGDVNQFADIAGCAVAAAETTSLRKLPTGVACGDDLPGSKCIAPEDACAEGWHICLRDGDAAELTARTEAVACQVADRASDGTIAGMAFLAAAGLAYSDADGPACANDAAGEGGFACTDHGDGDECLACCGSECGFAASADFAQSLWGSVETPVWQAPRCDSVSLDATLGVLCCRDGEVTQ